MSTLSSSAAASIAIPTLLSRVLRFDALLCLLMGLLLLAAAPVLSPWLGLPVVLLQRAGGVLWPCAALMAWTARAVRPAAVLVWLIILGNLAWVLASVGVVRVWFDPTPLGAVVLLVQALAVLLLAELEYVAWRRLR